MIRMKRIISILLLLIVGLNGFSQSVIVPSLPTGPSIVSPEVSSIIRYDNPSVNLNTGGVNLKVPLVSFDDPDFNLDISISYSMDGFKPLEPDNFVGMGWRLNCDGVIMREIHGIPDDFEGIWTTNLPGADTAIQVRGFRGFPNSSLTERNVIRSALSACDSASLVALIREATFGRGGEKMSGAFRSNKMDVSPDVFRFNFCGHSGKFIIGLDGKPIVISDDGGRYKVDLLQYPYRPMPNQDTESIIRITTDDGYIYTFGGHYDSMEYMALDWSDFTNSPPNPADTAGRANPNLESFVNNSSARCNRVVAYHLTRVQAPNGRIMVIDYVHHPVERLHLYPDELILSPSQYHDQWDSLALHYTIIPSLSVGVESHATTVEGAELAYQMNKTALIRKISTEYNTITFDYSSIGNPFFDLSRQQVYLYSIPRLCGARLDRVEKKNIISGFTETVSLSYIPSYQVHNRLLLAEVSNSLHGKHHFEYAGDNGFQQSLTIDIDKWGFWNGLHSNTNLAQQAAETGLFHIDSMEFDREEGDRNREPSGRCFDTYMLRSVRFPTGGSIEYDYEPHDYGSYFDWSAKTRYQNSYLEVGTRKLLAGGARVHSERFVDGNDYQKNRVRYYRYEQDDLSGSTGTLVSMGDNYLQGYMRHNGGAGNYHSCFRNECGNVNNPHTLGGHVRYSVIREYDVSGKTTPVAFDPDSTYTFYVHDLERDREGSLEVRVGGHGRHEYDSQWIFHGGRSSFRIVRIFGNEEVYNHTFVAGEDDIILYPYSSFGVGDYRIEFTVAQFDYLNVSMFYPRVRSLDEMLAGIPFKETRFTPTPVSMARNAFWISLLQEGQFDSAIDPSPEARYFRLLQNKYHFSTHSDRSPESGKVFSETWYNGSGEKVREIINQYTSISKESGWFLQPHPFVVGSPFENYVNVVEIPMYMHLPSQTTEKEYGANGICSTTITDYTYDADGYLTSTIIHGSDGKNLRKDFFHIGTQTDTVARQMQERNILAPLAEENWSVNNAGIYSRKNHYGISSSAGPVLSQVDVGNNGYPAIPRVHYPLYDDYGNILQTITDGRSTFTLWSYRGKYPVAFIENATLQQVRDALSVPDLSSVSRMATLPTGFWDSFRAALPDAIVTTCYYSPGIGITEMTDPMGLTKRFSYDEKGRLVSVAVEEADGSWSTLTAYEYHLLNE